MENRFEKIEELIEFDDQGQKVQRQNLASSVCTKFWHSLSRVILVFLVISSEKASGTQYPKVAKEYTWLHIHMADLKEIKQTIASY